MLQTANADNNHEPVHSPQLSNAFHMDLKKVIRNSLLGKVLNKQQVKKSSEPRPSNNLTRAAEFRFEGNKKRQEELPNKWTDQRVQEAVNKQEPIMQVNSAPSKILKPNSANTFH